MLPASLRTVIRPLILIVLAIIGQARGQSQDMGAEIAQLIAAGSFAQAEAALIQLVGAEKYAAAEEPLRTLVAAQPRIPRYKYLLGFTLAGRFRYPEAESLLREAIAAEPGRHDWLLALAKCLLEQNRNREASEVLERAVALAPKPEYRFARAMCLLNIGEPDAAERELRAVLREQPDHAEALYKLGVLLADHGDDAKSADLFRRCLAARPTHVEARFRLGVAESRAGSPAASIEQFEAVLEQVPGHVGATYNLGRELLRAGRTEEGRQRLEQFRLVSELEDRIQFQREFLKKDPASVEKRLELARLLLEGNRLPEAQTELRTLIALDPRRPTTYRYLATLFERTGRRDDQLRATAYADELGRQTP